MGARRERSTDADNAHSLPRSPASNPSDLYAVKPLGGPPQADVPLPLLRRGILPHSCVRGAPSACNHRARPTNPRNGGTSR